VLSSTRTLTVSSSLSYFEDELATGGPQYLGVLEPG